MDLKQVGEFGLIDIIKADTINNADNVVVGIGDDAAAVVPTAGQLQLLTTDMLVENVHFKLSTTTPWQLGYKAVAVNLSDIGAMGGAPRQVLVSIAIPRTMTVDFIVDLYKGMKDICREFGVNIIGGDTVSSPSGLVINIAVLGEVAPHLLTRRAGAKVGDVIAVTGTLGNSGCGLDLLASSKGAEQPFAKALITAHLTPYPQVAMGQLLAAYGATSMDDISDGLASEANEIAAASKVGVRIVAADVPLSPELKAAAVMLDKKPLDYALYGGEDFQLVFTMEQQAFNSLQREATPVPVTKIGEIIDASFGVVLVNEDGMEVPLRAHGYNHFR